MLKCLDGLVGQCCTTRMNECVSLSTEPGFSKASTMHLIVTHTPHDIPVNVQRRSQWEVIFLTVPVTPGQPSGAATSECPSASRLPLRSSCKHTCTHTHTASCMKLKPGRTNKIVYKSCRMFFTHCHFICILCPHQHIFCKMKAFVQRIKQHRSSKNSPLPYSAVSEINRSPLWWRG